MKEGEIHSLYDTGFVFAEVNADTIYWQKNKKGEFEAVFRNRNTVGAYKICLVHVEESVFFCILNYISN